MNDDHLLDETILAPNSQLPSPLTFSTQIVRRFQIKRFTMRKGDAVNLNNNHSMHVDFHAVYMLMVNHNKLHDKTAILTRKRYSHTVVLALCFVYCT